MATWHIIFSDLDGTLLDHDTYSFAAAQPALDLMRKTETPLILASSKTAAEIAPIRDAVGFSQYPAIVENGAGLLAANTTPEETDRAECEKIRSALDDLPTHLREYFRGFGDMSVEGIMQVTGLPSDAAALAAKRAFSEPGLWSGSDDDRDEFITRLKEVDISARDGGRFLTLSFGRTKADQMADIRTALFDDGKVTTVALGDAPNDTEMLITADRGFIVANPHAKPIDFSTANDSSHISRTDLVGPAGWNEAVLSVLSAQN
ncbi:MAG: HAD-IIB family hydrolase [Pseudomonadota bacterium]